MDCVVRDEAAERARKERLGDSFESERQKAKAEGRQWLLTKPIQRVIGPVAGQLFFLPGISVAQRLQEIQIEAQRQFLVLASENLRTAQIKSALHELGRLVDQIRHEFDRLDALQQVFHPDNLMRVVSWANGLLEEKERRAALFDSRRHPQRPGQFVAQGRSITDSWSGATVSLSTYRVPKRTLVECLTEVLSLNVEPGPAANINNPRQ